MGETNSVGRGTDVCRADKSWVVGEGDQKIRSAKTLLLALRCDAKAGKVFKDMIENGNALQRNGLGGGVGPNARAAIRIVQEGLVQLGYLKADKLKPNFGTYGSSTREAVDKFQKDHNIEDGREGTKFGRKSLKAMVDSLREKIRTDR